MDRQRLRRVFDLLAHLSASPATLSEISQTLEIPLSSTHDLLQGLLDLDVVSLQHRTYAIGPRIIGLAIDILDSNSVQRVARRPLEQLAADTQLDAYLAIRSGSGVVYVSRHSSGAQAVNIDIPLGRRLYLHSTAVGKLFAALDQDMYNVLASAPKPAVTTRTHTTMEQLESSLRSIRATQVSLTHGESMEGVVGLATPVRDIDGTLIAATHLSALEAVTTPTKIQHAIALMQECSRAIEEDLRRQLSD